MSERIDDLEKTVCKLVEESNVNDHNNIAIERNSNNTKISSNKIINDEDNM
jgi:hypothetical protein